MNPNDNPRTRRISAVWLIPLIAVLIGLWLVFSYLSSQGPVITQAQMLIMPPDPARAAGPVIRIGPACRICPRKTCPARREPSILATA